MLRLDLPPTAVTRGVFTRVEAEHMGWTTKSIRRRVVQGAWLELHRSSYVEAARWEAATPQLRHAMQSIAAALGRRVVVAGPSAACVQGFAVLSVPGTPCLLRAADLPPDHVTDVAGVLVTREARTVIDCARQGGFEAGVVVADSALRLQAVTRPALVAMLERGKHWNAIQVARAAVDEADARSESPLESLSRVRLLQCDLPRPDLQHVIEVGPGESYRVDFHWKDHRTIGEADGMVKYDDRSVLRAEKRRELALCEAGFEIVRWSWEEIWSSPDLVAQRVRRTFARAATRFGL